MLWREYVCNAAGPFKHTLTIKPVTAANRLEAYSLRRSGQEPAHSDEPDFGDVDMFRAESTQVSLSCGGIFEQNAVCAALGTSANPELETDMVWGDEFEEYMHSMDMFAEKFERSARV